MKVPLLEYLDKLEADRTHILATEPSATRALIAKLRELAILARRAREASTESTISWRELDEALTIEVPDRIVVWLHDRLQAVYAALSGHALEAENEDLRGRALSVDERGLRDKIRKLLKSDKPAGELRKAIAELVR